MRDPAFPHAIPLAVTTAATTATSLESTVALAPDGTLYLLASPASATMAPAQNAPYTIPERIFKAFSESSSKGLLQLGLSEGTTPLPADLSFWRELSQLYFARLCALPGLGEATPDEILAAAMLPSPDELLTFANSAPPMVGGEYLNPVTLSHLWEGLHSSFLHQLKESHQNITEFFATHPTPWNLVGRVCFHLAENKASADTPFAFLATYSPKLSAHGKAQYLPLGKALQEYTGEKHKSQLLQLLLPVQKASEKSSFLKSLVETREIYHPLAWTPQEAYQFLKDIPHFESSGVLVRVPDWWKAKKPPRPQVNLTVGGKKDAILGVDSLLKFSVNLSMDGEPLTNAELKQILASTSGLALIRGKWAEVDPEKLKAVLDHWKAVESSSAHGEVTFIEGMRLLSGARGLVSEGASERNEDALDATANDWTSITAGESLSKLLEQLKDPAGNLKDGGDPGNALKASLRPYQKTGVRWLWFLGRLGIGACLADDMGLGKTIQVISLFLILKREKKGGQPNLLVVPASLLGNWKSEMEHFAPSLHFTIIHPSAQLSSRTDAVAIQSSDVIMTTYGYLQRETWLTETQWNCIVIDEAQAIKNSSSKQTRAVKSLKAQHRIALTGTPVENRLSDLWSLYDFLCPGLLGSAKSFTRYIKGAEKDENEKNRYAALRNLIRPYLLRRLKSDKSIISDLPDKTELSAYCSLTKTQAVLYQQSVTELSMRLKHQEGAEALEGIKRRGVILSFLMRLKQICNHPSQWLADGQYSPDASGKFTRLREICEQIKARQEKVLVFTQFREMTEPLSDYLNNIFGRPGLVLHGGTPVKKRKELVDAFNKDHEYPYFILSLKAGGTGLNLTSASHVIHFDRWWNPAVENQATDRAYRIGQKRNVLVHKFVCQGTIEEKIDTLIASKQSLSKEILEGSGDAILTELGNDELLKMVSLDIQSATEEA